MSDHASGFPGAGRSAPVSRARPAASRPRRFLQGLVFALLLEALVALPGCAGPERNFWIAEAGEAAHRVYVVQRGWHTGIAVRQAEIAPGLWPEQADFREGGYLEAGWGDFEFYQAGDSAPGMATAAGLWSTRSVLNVERIPEAVPDRYPCSAIIELRVPSEQFGHLVRFIHETFDRGAGGRVAPLASSFPGHSHFYPARGRFHMLNNCNTWVLRGFQAAGYPVSPMLAVTAASVRSRMSRFGRLIGPRADCR